MSKEEIFFNAVVKSQGFEQDPDAEELGVCLPIKDDKGNLVSGKKFFGYSPEELAKHPRFFITLVSNFRDRQPDWIYDSELNQIKFRVEICPMKYSETNDTYVEVGQPVKEEISVAFDLVI